MATLLVRIEPELGMDRWYSVSVQPTLFEPVVVVCSWGSRRNSYRRSRVLPVKSVDEAERIAEEIVEAKVGRGYRAVNSALFGFT